MSHETVNSILIALLAAGQAGFYFYNRKKLNEMRTRINFDLFVNYPQLWDALDELELRVDSINERLEHVVVKSPKTVQSANSRRKPTKKAAAKKVAKKAVKKAAKK